MGSSGGSMDQQLLTAACRMSWAAQYEASGNKMFHTMSAVWYVSNCIDSERRGGESVSSLLSGVLAEGQQEKKVVSWASGGGEPVLKALLFQPGPSCIKRNFLTSYR